MFHAMLIFADSFHRTGFFARISQTFDVLQHIKKGEKLVAIIAPSILGQFKTSIDLC